MNPNDHRTLLPDNICQVNVEGLAARIPAGFELQNTTINANRDVSIIVGSRYENRDHSIKLMHTITDWVSLHNFHEVHKDVLEKVTPGTSTWILSNPVFSKWVNRDCEALIGTGIPGAGKTCLISVVIEHLKSLIAPSHGSVAIAYVYCRYKDQLSTAQVLASLLRQLIEQSSDVLHYIDQGLYATCLKTRTTPRQLDFLKALQGAVQLFSKIFLVVDALDELEEQVCYDVIESLQSLHQSLFVTSRPIPLSNFSGLELKIQAPSSDFQRIIEDQIGHSPRLKWLLVQSTLQNVLDKIEEKSQGMLLLASLQIHSLTSRGITNLKSLETTLNAMPVNINQLYEHIFERIATLSHEEQSLANRAVLWVTYAARFLRVDELLEILAIDLKTATFDRQLCTREEIILSVCLGLLHIEQETRTVHLIHYTAQEFLQGHGIITSINPHVFLADISAIYLSTRKLNFVSFKSMDDLKEVQVEHPFFNYAINYLGYHTTRACLTSYDRLPEHVECLFSHQTSIILLHTIFGYRYVGHITLLEFAAYYGLQNIFIDKMRDTSISANMQNSALFYACLGGQIVTVKALLAQGQTDLKYQTLYGATFLHAAAERGNAESTKLLIWEKNNLGNTVLSGIDMNAQLEGVTALLMAAWEGHHDVVEALLGTPSINANIKRWDDVTPLWISCQNGHEPVVKLLLGTPGIDINAKNKDNVTPLHIACKNGHEPVVKLLLGIPGIDVNAKNTYDFTPLHSACQYGHEPVVKLLLGTPGININAKNRYGFTSLYTACQNGHESVVKLLLGTYGIDVNTKTRYAITPLYIACQYGHEPVVKLLLGTPGIDVNAKDEDNTTALHSACRNGYECVVKFLLGTPGIDVNPKDEYDATPLHTACQNGHEPLVKLLLDTPGIELNLKAKYDFTPLHSACQNSHEHLVKLLLGTPGIVVNSKNEYDATPLHIACKNGHEPVVKLLLGTLGIDVNAKDEDNATPLHTACKNGYEPVVKLLLGIPGIDINAKDEDNATPLHSACWNGHEPVVKLLLGTPGINVNAKNEDNATSLHNACWNSCEPVVKLLLGTPGIELNVKAKNDFTPLYIACQNGHEPVVKLLLGIPGIDVNAKNTYDFTPLHSACQYGHEPVVKLLLGTPGINVNAKNEDNATSLHNACWNGCEPVVKLLLGTPGIELNVKAKNDFTPLYIACQNGHEPVVKLLLGIPGIDVNAKNTYDFTPLHIACQYGHEPVVKLLLGTPGIDVNAKDEVNATPLWIAYWNGHKSVVNHLMGTPGIELDAEATEWPQSPKLHARTDRSPW